jgi:serine/threonine-protein kinase
MLTGDVPYHGDSPLAVMGQRVTTDAPLLRKTRPDLPAPVEAIVWRALRREPAERYASMAGMRHDLTHLDEVAIPEYPTSSTQGRGPKITREHLVTVAVVVGVFVLLAVIGVVAQLAHTAKGSP